MYNLLPLLLSQLYNLFRRHRGGPIATTFPPQIGSYAYVRKLSEPVSEDIVVGLYRDRSGHQVIAKIWAGKFKNYSYFSLHNEYQVYQILTAVAARVAPLLPPRLRFVHIPALINYTEGPHSAILCLEYVPGRLSTDLPDQELQKTYLLSVDYLEYLSAHLTPQELRLLSRRHALHYASIFPLLLVIAWVRQPGTGPLLLRAWLGYVRALPAFLTERSLTLVHRDLHFENILVTGRHIYLLDFQMCVLTYPVCEYINTLQYCWDKNRLRAEILTLISSKYGDDPLVKLLMIQHGVHCLIGRNFSPQVIQSFIHFLRFGVSL